MEQFLLGCAGAVSIRFARGENIMIYRESVTAQKSIHTS
jgi:hypothetical protein